MRTVSPESPTPRFGVVLAFGSLLIRNDTEYLSTTIVLDKADSAFGDTLSLNEATSSGLTTSDSGVTWSVDTININAYTY